MSDRKKAVIAVVILLAAVVLLAWQFLIKGRSNRPGPVPGQEIEQPDTNEPPRGGLRTPGGP